MADIRCSLLPPHLIHSIRWLPPLRSGTQILISYLWCRAGPYVWGWRVLLSIVATAIRKHDESSCPQLNTAIVHYIYIWHCTGYLPQITDISASGSARCSSCIDRGTIILIFTSKCFYVVRFREQKQHYLIPPFACIIRSEQGQRLSYNDVIWILRCENTCNARKQQHYIGMVVFLCSPVWTMGSAGSYIK